MSYSQVNNGSSTGAKFNMGLRNQEVTPKITQTGTTRPIYYASTGNQNTSVEGRISRGGSRTLKAQQELDIQNRLKPSIMQGGILTREKYPNQPSQNSFTNNMRVLTEKNNNTTMNGDHGSTHNLLTGNK